jgi:hypothetical protein
MPEAISVLTVRRPVQNITQERIDTLGGYLLERTDSSAEALETVQGLLNPADKMHAAIIAKGEFLRIQRKLGEDRLDDDRVEELEARLEEAFSDHPETLDTETLPVQQQHWGEVPKLMLTIAKSVAVARERRLAQDVIFSFTGMERGSRGWFGRSKKITPVRLAVSETSKELSLLNRLKVIVEEGTSDPEEERPLPTSTKLGKVKTIKSVEYLRD